jgi:hypothetical protein
MVKWELHTMGTVAVWTKTPAYGINVCSDFIKVRRQNINSETKEKTACVLLISFTGTGCQMDTLSCGTAWRTCGD